MKIIHISGPGSGRGNALPGVAGRLPGRGGTESIGLKKAEAPNPKSEKQEKEDYGVASGKSREEDV